MTSSNQSGGLHIPPTELRGFAEEVFIESGLVAKHASTLADALVTANLRGVDSHGIVRLEPYVRNIEGGGFNPDPDVSAEIRGDGALVVDADDGPGQVGTAAAMDAVIGAAKDAGVAFATVKNSNHFGTAAYYTRMAAQEGCIGFAMTNVGPNVAPFGGVDPYFGTNPLGYSIPTDRSFHITLDMATSTVAKGKIIMAEKENESIPDHWAIDESGEPTSDPEDVHSLRPVGGAKGYGLGLLVDVCSGILSGMGPSPEVDSLYDDYSKPQRVGHFVGAIDISKFYDLDLFKEQVDTMITDLKSQRTMDSVDEVMLPGEIEAETMERRRRSGIPIGEGTLSTLEEIGRRYDVSPVWR